jgi:two-component system, OmpR family, sensor kinase
MPRGTGQPGEEAPTGTGAPRPAWREAAARAQGRVRRLGLGPRIALHQVVTALMLLASAGATLVAVERIDYYIDRDRIARRQLDVLIRLTGDMNRYSENIAELLLLGRGQITDFNEARAAAEASLTELQELSTREVTLVRSDAERTDELAEATRVAELRTLYARIDRAVQRLLELRDGGLVDEAVQRFLEDVEEGLDAEFERVIETSIAAERAELRQLEQETNRLEQRLFALVVVVGAAAMVLSGVAGLMLRRSLAAPLREIAAATRAMGEGDLSVRLSEDRPVELAALARQFNGTAARLEAEHTRLLQVQAGLEDEVARRTADLEEANARLQRLDHLRMLFLADIGHELRTPLTILRGEAEVALRTGRTREEHADTLGRVARIARQMGRLVEDLLFLARAEVGAVRFDMQPIDLHEVTEVALSEAQVLASGRGLALHPSLPEMPLRIEGDAERLTQALLIVLDNAVKYADEGTAVEAALRPEGAEAVVIVTNRGAAIPAADLPFIFNRFYRGRGGAAERSDGSGLGLSIAKWILDTHGGSIALASGEGRTTATIRLPLRQGDAGRRG